MSLPPALAALFDQAGSLERHGLIVERTADGTVRANVAHVVSHSPTGFECGYGGSGPADLALSVMHALLPPVPEAEEAALDALDGRELEAALDDPMRTTVRAGASGQRVSALAWQLHQRFKADFIARMPREGGMVPIAEIRAWIEAERGNLATVGNPRRGDSASSLG